MNKHDEYCHSVLGISHISPTLVETHTGLTYTKEHLDELYRTIPPREVLDELEYKNYILAPEPPWSFDVCRVVDCVEGLWFSWLEVSKSKKVMLSKKKDNVRGIGWLALKKELHPDSRGLSWDDQIKLLRYGEYVPTLSIAMWVLGIYTQERNSQLKGTPGVLLFEGFQGRTCSVTKPMTEHIKLSRIRGTVGGLHFSVAKDRKKDNCLGLVSALDLKAIGKLHR